MADEKTRRPSVKRREKAFYIKITAVIIAVIVLAAGCIYSIHGRSYDSLITSVANHSDVIKAVTAQVFIVRDEDYVTVDSLSNIVSAVDDGARVGKGNCVAYSFKDSSSAFNIKQINEIQSQLDYYNRIALSGGNSAVTELSVLDGNIRSSLYDFISGVSNGNLTDFDVYETELREQFVQKQISTGNEIDVSSNIVQLEAKLSALKNSCGDYTVITAPHTGYYISTPDGYENTLDYSKVNDWTQTDIINALNSQPESVPSNAIGKLVDGYYWYITCVVDSDLIPGLSIGDRKTLSFPYSTADNVKAEVVRLKNAPDGNMLVVFKCNQMDGSVCDLRNETAQIYLEEYSGCKIDNRAIREVNGEKGVYVKRANTAVFKKIYIKYETDDYAIVGYPPETDDDGNGIYYDTDDYLGLYDEYIIGGTDLYDGKYLK